ncbi:hypothetical protein BsWGS_01682 [Bradybaena similaris]
MEQNMMALNSTLLFQNSNVPADDVLQSEPLLPIYITVYVTLINIIIFFVGIVGNVLVIVVIARVKDMRTTMNLYLVNLSAADLLVLFVCQPTAMLELYAKERWLLGNVVCKLIPVLEHTTMQASTLTIVVITFERYHAICRPLDVFLRCNRPRPLSTLLCVWAIAIVASLPFVAMTTLGKQPYYDGTQVDMCETKVNEVWHYCFHLTTTTIFFVLPLLLLTILYSRIIRKLYQSDLTNGRIRCEVKESTGYSLRSRRQVIRMLITLVILFFLSLAPLRVVIVWHIFSPPDSIPRLGIESYYNVLWLCRLLIYLNSAGNPLIYSLLSSKFKIAFSFLLRCQTRMLDRRSRQRTHLHNLRQLYRRSTEIDPFTKHQLNINLSSFSKRKSSVFHKCSYPEISNFPAENPCCANSNCNEERPPDDTQKGSVTKIQDR